MKWIDLKWNDISMGNSGGDSPYIIVFITNEMFRTPLLNSLGNSLKIEFKEEYNGNVMLTITLLDTDEYTVYNTNKSIKDYPLLIHLKNHNVASWSVGHIREGSVSFHLPLRHLTS